MHDGHEEGRGPDPARRRDVVGWLEAVERLREDRLWATVVAVGAAVLLLGGYLGYRQLAPPVGPPVEELLPRVRLTPTSASTTIPPPLVVHVVGAVRQPGVRELPPGSRILDAVSVAGGPTEDADLARLNLAAPVADGAQIRVPLLGEEPSGPLIVEPVPPEPAIGTGAPVDLNAASAAELESLPGIGPATAAAVIAWRDANGTFTSVEQLLEVRGIGPGKLDAIRPLVTVR